jgi:hypothetical protein
MNEMRTSKLIPVEDYSSGLHYDTILGKLSGINIFIKYLETKGLKPLNTRVGEYARVLERYLSDKSTKEDIHTKVIFAIREIDEWLWIYKGLIVNEPKNVIDIVKKAIGGPHFARDEYENTLARNIQLELRIASYFLQNGFDVDISSISDLVVQVNGVHVFVECKRLNSRTQVLKRAKEAKRQLNKRYKSINSPSNGIVVLDVGRVIQPDQGIATSPNFEFGRQQIKYQILDFNERFNTQDIFAKDDRLIFVWMQAIVATWFELDKEPGTRFTSIHSLYANKGQRRWDLWETIKPILETT